MTTPTHETFREQLLDLAYGELARREERALRRHLEGCAECTAELARLTSTRSAMAALSDEPAPERGEAILLAAAREAARARGPRPLLRSWLWGASLSAVGLTVVAVLSVRLAGQAPPTGLEARPAESVAHAPPLEPAPVQAGGPTANEPRREVGPGAALADAGQPSGDEADGAGVRERVAPAKPMAKGAPAKKEAVEQEHAGTRVGRALAGKDLKPLGGLGGLEGAVGGKRKSGETRLDGDRFAAAPPAEPPPAADRTPAPAPPPARLEQPRDEEGLPSSAKAAPPAAELAERPAAPAASAAGAASAPPRSFEAAERKADAARRRSADAAASSDAAGAAQLARGAEDAFSRHARLRAVGQLRTVARRFPGCAGEAERTVELDQDDQVVKVTRRGTWQGKPYTAELFYGDDGALGAVRFSSGGQVRELRAGALGTAGDTADLPEAATHPRRAADAGPDAPPRCG